MREVVQVVVAHGASTGHDVLLEASGGLTLDNAKDVAETGVHFISVGELTHSSPILDIGLDFETLASSFNSYRATDTRALTDVRLPVFAT